METIKTIKTKRTYSEYDSECGKVTTERMRSVVYKPEYVRIDVLELEKLRKEGGYSPLYQNYWKLPGFGYDSTECNGWNRGSFNDFDFEYRFQTKKDARIFFENCRDDDN